VQESAHERWEASVGFGILWRGFGREGGTMGRNGGERAR